MTTYQTNAMRVGHDAPIVALFFAVTLADNGAEGDRRIWLKAAPEIGTGNIIIYATTNGDPQWLASYNGLEMDITAQGIDDDAWTGFAEEFGCDPDEFATFIESKLIDARILR